MCCENVSINLTAVQNNLESNIESVQNNLSVGIATNTAGIATNAGELDSRIFKSSENSISVETEHLPTGINNIGIGTDSLKSNTKGNENISIGHESLYNNISGENNMSIGHESLYNNISGENNISIGNESLYNNISGESNISIGNGSQWNNVSGENNISLGIASLYNNSSGYDNISIGAGCMENNISGHDNISIGTQSLNTNISGRFNIGMGTESLENNDGNYNIAVGAKSGMASITNNMNGSIFIGYNSLPDNTASNAQIVIGTNIQGQGQNTVSIGSNNNIIWADFSSSGSWNHISDVNLKENIIESTMGLSFINDLTPVTYNWRKKENLEGIYKEKYKDSKDNERIINDKTHHGFVAQQIKEVIENNEDVPDGFNLWTKTDDGIEGMSEGALIPILVKAIQELNQKIKILEDKIN